MREDRFHNKITWFTFIFSILVVWVHSVNTAAGGGAVLENFLGGTIGQIAVPGFFMMSGYLFYRNFSWEKLGGKWGSRVRGILVPFLLWNGLYYMGYVLGSRLPFVRGIMEKGPVPFDWHTAGAALLHYTYNPVFWYLYQLILLVSLAPALYGILKNKIPGLAAVGTAFFLAQRGVIIPHLNLDALFYYSLAAYGGIHGRSLVEGEGTVKKAAAGMGLMAFGAAAYMARWPGVISATVCFRTAVPVGLWFFTDGRQLPEARWWMKYNFYIYAVHYGLVRVISKTAAAAFGDRELVMTVLFLAMPAVMVWIAAGTGKWLRQRVPALWSVLNGGR